MDIWSILAIQLIALVGGAITGAVALALGGAGSLRVISSRLNLLEEAVEHTDDRVTKEVKTRAGLAAAEKRRSAASVAEEAEAVLLAAGKAAPGAGGAPRAGKRPSVVNLT